jgi:hypothetical protein
MSETLRPSTLGEILDRTAQLYRRNFWLFAGVAALPIAIIIAVTALALGTVFAVPGIRGGGPESGFLTGLALVLFLLVVVPIYVAAAVFSYAGLTEAAASVHRGEKITIRGVLNAVRPWFWRYLWFGILQAIVIALVPGAIAGVVIGFLVFSVTLVGGGSTATGVAIAFLMFFIGFGAFGVIIWRALGYSIGLSVCVVEKKPAWESLQRAWKLSQGTRGRIFVLYLLIFALAMAGSMIGYIVSAIVGAVAGVVGNGGEYAAAAAIVAGVLYLVVDFTVQVLLAPVSWIALVLFYYDQRIRKEGFDIEWMMQQAGLTQPAAATPPIEGASISGLVAPPDTVEEP